MTDLGTVVISRADALADAAESYLTTVGERQARLAAKALWAALASYQAARIDGADDA
jgi:hypothetical protein